MSWVLAHYYAKIVIPYGVHLQDWPEDIPFNPHNLGTTKLIKLLKAFDLDNPECRWVKLTEEELAEKCREADTLPEKPRKGREDKGRKRGPHKKKKHARKSSSDEESDGTGKPISPEIVEDSD